MRSVQYNANHIKVVKRVHPQLLSWPIDFANRYTRVSFI